VKQGAGASLAPKPGEGAKPPGGPENGGAQSEGCSGPGDLGNIREFEMKESCIVTKLGIFTVPGQKWVLVTERCTCVDRAFILEEIDKKDLTSCTEGKLPPGHNPPHGPWQRGPVQNPAIPEQPAPVPENRAPQNGGEPDGSLL
jgi:hypothetical protein